MKEENIRKPKVLENNLILPHQPESDYFLGYMKKFLHFSRWFGIAGSESKYWKAWGVCLLTGLLVIDATAIWRVIKALGGFAADTTGSRSMVARLSGTVFYTTATLSLIFCWRFSASWKKLSDTWTSIDKSIGLSLPPDQGLKKRLILVTSFLVIGATCEHIMSMVALIGVDCPPSLWLKRYILSSNGYLFQTKNYSVCLAIILFVMGKIATALWNFHDLLIVLLCMGLKSRYLRLNEYVSRVITYEKKEYKWCKDTDKIKQYNWRKIREAYVEQAVLVRVYDNAIGGIIVLSSASNFYFICMQLFLGITQGFSTDQLKRLYYLLSLIWLIVRISFAILSAANVNVHSKGALRFLHVCETKCFNIEVERLQTQISRDNVYLSGIGLFRINRTILLKMAAAIITYELVLIEFDEN